MNSNGHFDISEGRSMSFMKMASYAFKYVESIYTIFLYIRNIKKVVLDAPLITQVQLNRFNSKLARR